MNNNIIIAAGGTGGHIFPGIAIAEELIGKNYNVIWIGTKHGLEAKLIPQHKIQIYYIKATGFRGKNWLYRIATLFNLVVAIWQSLLIIIKFKPFLVLGLGGFVSAPVGIAAWVFRKKLIIHEQNAIAGTTNKVLYYLANYVFESFPNSFYKSNTNLQYNNKIILTGNPIRRSLLILRSRNRSIIKIETNKRFHILVLGGSRGARFLNQIIPAALSQIENIKILHQTGTEDFQSTLNDYNQNYIQHHHEIKPFIDNMENAYSWADLVICRSGASTVFEIMAIGLASILIPLPWSIDDHQKKNALYLSNNNAAVVLNQNELNSIKLKNIVLGLLDCNKLQTIRSNAKSLYNNYEDNESIGGILDKYIRSSIIL